jgi:hypothetical protein
MNNEPVAWMSNGKEFYVQKNYCPDFIPLYTHPIKEQKCVVKDCENHRNEGGFTGDLCNPCYQFIANGEGVYSQAYRNVHPAKELTDEEIWDLSDMVLNNSDVIGFARAILRKATK